jgi:hypothetical protein
MLLLLEEGLWNGGWMFELSSHEVYGVPLGIDTVVAYV